MIRRLLRRWRTRNTTSGDWCETCALDDLTRPPRFLTVRDVHAVVETFTDATEAEGDGVESGAAVTYCPQHCPGGCTRGCQAVTAA